ncbi:unnamed protein product [Bemisia tabaci]|uniref:Ig-like domain-containing protein n=1 Tax=Bemisia tabaci TaxID=7038 RepID=A0A9P0G145_BEMTA|nr:unnamed protein product [Bemisia tabaci]
MTNMLALCWWCSCLVLALVRADDALDFQKTLPAIVAWAVQGGEARLPCDVSGDRVNMVLWFKDSTGIPLYSLDARGGNVRQATHWAVSGDLGERCSSAMGTEDREAILTIKNVNYDDQGIYRCRVDFMDSPTKNYRVNLTLAVPPSTPVIMDMQGKQMDAIAGPYFEGYDLHLTCLVTGGEPRPTVRWWLGNTMLDSISDKISESTVINRLFINNVARSMLGQQLECHAQSLEGAPPLVTKVSLEIYLKPLHVTILSGNEMLSAEKSKQIICETAGSHPTAKITWLLDGKPIKHDAKMVADGVNSTMGTLTFRPEVDDDGKELVCKAENPKYPGAVIEAKTILRVAYAPTVSVSVGSDVPLDQLQEGSGVQFTCEVHSNPPPDRITWFHGNKVIEGSSDRILLLTSLTRELAGDYSCLASNKEGASKSTPVRVTVRHPPVCRSGFERRTVGAMLHEMVEVRCEVEAWPQDDLEFFWQFNLTDGNSQVSRSRMSTDGPTSVLHYRPADAHDFGNFSCRASNALGMQSEPCHITVTQIGTPEPPRHCELTNTSSYGDLMIHCEAGFDGGLKQHFLLVVLEAGATSGHITSNEVSEPQDEGKRAVHPYPSHGHRGNGHGHSASTTDSHWSQPVYELRQDVPQFQLNGVSFGFYDLAVYAVNAKGKSQPPIVFPSVEISAITAKLTYSDKRMAKVLAMIQEVPVLYYAVFTLVALFALAALVALLAIRKSKTPQRPRAVLTTNQGIAPFEHVFIAGPPLDKGGNSDSEPDDEGGGRGGGGGPG